MTDSHLAHRRHGLPDRWPPENVARTVARILRTLPPDPDDTPRRILNRIKRDGYACTTVFPDPPGEPYGWTYTVGLCLHNVPELVIAHMPAQKAVVYLEETAVLQLATRQLEPGETVLMNDGSMWDTETVNPRNTFCGPRVTMRLFGGRQKVRAIRLLPPLSLRWLPGSSWIGYQCECGCQSRAGSAVTGLSDVSAHTAACYIT